jgi:hypothetical protein
MTKLTSIKIIHTIIWILFNAVICYLSYAVITNKIDSLVWICVCIILMEGIVLISFKTMCPLTIIARKYSDSHKDNFDIFLPNWLAKYNKLIYTVIIIIIFSVLAYERITS